MTKSSHLGDVMETCCNQCHSRYRITDQQLKAALGKVRCGECGKVFDALQSLKSFEGMLPSDFMTLTGVGVNTDSKSTPGLSLHEAMYGTKRGVFTGMSPLLWLTGILLLSTFSIVQVVYYQRYG